MRAQWTILAVVTFGLTVGAARCAPPSANIVHAPRASPAERDGALVDTKERPAPEGQDVLIPERPEVWQKQKDCDPDIDEHLVNGACYARMSRKPPCGPKLRRHGDACYRFVAKAPREPSSIQR